MILYFCLMLLANAVLAIIFHQSITVTLFSLIPLFLIGIMIFQSVYFKSDDGKHAFSPSYHSGFTHKEVAEMSLVASKALLYAVPLMIPFVLFFSSLIKAVSIIVYLVSFAAGPLVYRIKNKDSLNRRANSEKKELETQLQKEELGKWK